MNEKHRQAIAAAQRKKIEVKPNKANGSPEVSRYRKILEILGALIFTAVGMTTSLPTLVALPIWTIAFAILLYAALDAIPHIDKFSFLRKSSLCLLITLLCLDLCGPFLRHRYMKEKAAALDGYILTHDPWGFASPVIEFGDSGVKYPWRPTDEPLNLLKDADLSLRAGENGINISTTIRDHAGNRVVWIENNHWHVAPPPASADKNFTDDTLEVLDGGGHVVLQVHMLPDRIQVRGEWHDKFGHGIEIAECADPRNGKASGCVQKFGDGWPEEQKETPIEPIFEYPSSEHLGEFHKKK